MNRFKQARKQANFLYPVWIGFGLISIIISNEGILLIPLIWTVIVLISIEKKHISKFPDKRFFISIEC